MLWQWNFVKVVDLMKQNFGFPNGIVMTTFSRHYDVKILFSSQEYVGAVKIEYFVWKPEIMLEKWNLDYFTAKNI